MRRTLVMVVAVLLVAPFGNAWAQSGFEITPFAGYRWGGGMSTIEGIRQFDTAESWSYGVAIGRAVYEKGVEVSWTHFSGDVTATFNNGSRVNGGALSRDDIMLNGYVYAYRGDAAARPFFTLGMGATAVGTELTDTVWRFAWNVGLGVRTDPNEKIGLRGKLMWTPMWITTGSALWCDPFFCYSAGTGESYDQFELSLGLIIKM